MVMCMDLLFRFIDCLAIIVEGECRYPGFFPLSCKKIDRRFSEKNHGCSEGISGTERYKPQIRILEN